MCYPLFTYIICRCISKHLHGVWASLPHFHSTAEETEAPKASQGFLRSLSQPKALSEIPEEPLPSLEKLRREEAWLGSLGWLEDGREARHEGGCGHAHQALGRLPRKARQLGMGPHRAPGRSEAGSCPCSVALFQLSKGRGWILVTQASLSEGWRVPCS